MLIRRTQLKKLPVNPNSFHPDASNLLPSPEQEAEWLKHKHLGLSHDESFGQKSLGGFGGKGRPFANKPEMTEEEEHKFWAQMIRHGDNEKRMLKGGHGVPLSGELINPPARRGEDKQNGGS